MNLIEIMERFPDQESCIEHLEHIRWQGKPICPHCESEDVALKNETQEESKVGRTGRYNCHACRASFKVTQGTVFHGTKIPLQKWFLAIALMTNAKKSLSSYQLSRDLDLNQKTALFIQERLRAEMLKKTNAILLQGIIEADETYMGGKPRKENKKEDRKPAPRGRGTDKTAVIGVVERGGQVIAQVAENLTGRTILDFIKKAVRIEKSELITDEFYAYRQFATMMEHKVVNHKEQYVEGDKHTNTIEGFWSLLKRAWYGSHHHYTTLYMPLYVAERCYVYNNRHRETIFWKFLRDSMQSV